MKHTKNQTSTRTLTDLYRAIDHQHAVTITYPNSETGELEVRTVEPTDIRTTKSGSIVVRAMCRREKDARTFTLSKIVSYTCHRIAFVLDHTEATTPAGHVIVVRSEQQVIARELGRDYLPAHHITRTDTALVA